MSNIKKVIEQSHHRNGVGGASAVVSLFTVEGEPGTFVAISVSPDRPDNAVFPRLRDETLRDSYIRSWIGDFATHTVVLNVEETAKDNIAFAEGNSWRGADHYGSDLARAWREKCMTEGPYTYDPAVERYHEDVKGAYEEDEHKAGHHIEADPECRSCQLVMASGAQ